VAGNRPGVRLGSGHGVGRGQRPPRVPQSGPPAGLVAKDWTPRELRHSFVSLLSDNGMSIEKISRLMGHNGTTVTELVYRHQIRPVVEHGAEAMDQIFRGSGDDRVA
jgi:site-specific recombinase XerC